MTNREADLEYLRTHRVLTDLKARNLVIDLLIDLHERMDAVEQANADEPRKGE